MTSRDIDPPWVTGVGLFTSRICGVMSARMTRMTAPWTGRGRVDRDGLGIVPGDPLRRVDGAVTGRGDGFSVWRTGRRRMAARWDGLSVCSGCCKVDTPWVGAIGCVKRDTGVSNQTRYAKRS